MRSLRRFAARPAVHVIALGGLAFAAMRWWAPLPSAGASVARTDDEMLLDEALAAGLDRRDRYVRDRLAGLARMARDGEIEDAAGLEAEARRLGLERQDVVVRRHLVQAMELALAWGGPRQWPTDDELLAYLAAHPERFMQPERWRFTHVYFARDRPALDARTAAAAAAEQRRGGNAAAADPGDPFFGGAVVAGSEAEVARTFGAEFAAALGDLPVGRWVGPVPSAYGWHAVRVETHAPATPPALAAVRSRVVHAVMAERATQRVSQWLAAHRGSPS